jgi:signal peptidase I
LKSRSGLIIGIIVIGIIAVSALYASQGTNNIGVTIETNGTSDTTHVNFKSSLLHSPPLQMQNEIKEKVFSDINDYKSTVDSIKNDVNAIAQKYNYTASTTIISQFGTDQLPMPAQVSGTSMVPTLQDGQNITVLKTKNFKVNDIVVAYHPDYGLIVKRVGKINGNQVYLMSDNKNVEVTTTQKQLANGMTEIDTVTKTPLNTWVPKDNVIGVVTNP